MNSFRPNAALALAIACTVALAGCSGVRMRQDTATPPASPARAIYGSQVAIGKCAFQQRESLAGTLLSSAIAEGVNRLGAALQEAAARKEVTTTATRNVEVSNKAWGPCVQVVRGWFYVDPSLAKGALDDDPKFQAGLAATRGSYVTPQIYRDLWRQNGLWLADVPDFFFEGVFVPSSDNAALTVVPEFVHFGEPLFTRALRRDRSRHVAVFLAFHRPDEGAAAQDNPAATLIIGDMKVGETRRYPVSNTELTRFRVADVPAPLNRWPHESDWFTLALPDAPQPMIVSAAVTETQAASEFLGFVAAVFNSSKEQITEAVQTRIVPEKRREAKVAAATAASSLEEQIDAAASALIECRDASPATAASATAARKALREVNGAALSARVRPPVDDACIGSIRQTDSSDQIKGACQAALAKVTSTRSCKGG